MLSQGNVPCWCHKMPSGKKCITAILCLLLMTTFITFWWLPSPALSPDYKQDYNDPTVRRMLSLLNVDDVESLSPSELKRRIEELLRIKSSVQKDLIKLEEKRSDLQKQMAALVNKIEDLKKDATKQTTELEKLRISIEQAKTAQIELAERNTPELRPPLKLTALNSSHASNSIRSSTPNNCSFGSCFDLTRCPLSSGFPVYFYNNVYGWTSTKDGYGYLTNDPGEACLFVVSYHPALVLEQLKYWNGDGSNHVLIDINLNQDNASLTDLRIENAGKAMIASDKIMPRYGFDILVPSFKYLESPSDLWSRLPSLMPVRRKYLISFQTPQSKDLKEVKDIIEEPLALINDDKTDDKVVVDFHCKMNKDMDLCGTFESRRKLLEKSNFALIISSASLSSVLRRITEALETGAIPVFVCLPDCQEFSRLDLPLSQVLDWSRFSLFVPMSRITELHFLLRSFPDTDLFQMRHQGRQIWQHYFGSGPAVMSSILNLIRTRTGLPPAAIKEEPTVEIFDDNFKPQHMDSLPIDSEPEFLGPLEPPMPSKSYRRNFTFLIKSQDMWNDKFMTSIWLPPYTPYEPLLPTEAKFLGSSIGYRPINHGQGGSGKEFSQVLGGNSPSEQFTVVMLTYEREPVLMESLSRLYGLPYLNKVIVVWNSEIPPSPDLKWPEIGVPILVLKTSKNSLNNRFLPYDAIETEAVLSVDDDAHLRHDEIIFGFRVWRENRHKLVGFPGRFHAWDKDHLSWNYNSNYSCELSMVLTGAAFYHKYYSYAYSQWMPQAIRDKVDEFMNCEDLAMNFLISHMTREPPVKVTSRWTFRCPGCPVTLSEDESHFQERHKCINFFTQVYGYNPLLFTQYRVDSVLFKTRIPQDQQKCFKFI